MGKVEISHSYGYNVIFQLSTNSHQLFEKSDIDLSTQYNVLFLECSLLNPTKIVFRVYKHATAVLDFLFWHGI